MDTENGSPADRVGPVVMPYRFIGGSRDGESHRVTHERVRMPVVRRGNPNVADLDATSTFEEYRSFRIRGEVREFIVYAEAGLSPDEVLSLLIAKYQA